MILFATYLAISASPPLQPVGLAKLTIKHAMLMCMDQKDVSTLLFVRHDSGGSYVHVNDGKTGKLQFSAPIKSVLMSDNSIGKVIEIKSDRLPTGQSADVSFVVGAGKSEYSYVLQANPLVSARCAAVPGFGEAKK